LRLGLTAKLFALTLVFVLIAEVLIFVPSVANYRVSFLRDRLAATQVVALVLETAPDGVIPRTLERELLGTIGALTLSMKQGEARRLLAFADMPPRIDATFDVRGLPLHRSILDALTTLAAPDGRLIRVVGTAPRGGDFVEIVMDETPLRSAMWRFAWNIALLSLLISAITAALVYVALTWLLVRPMRRLHAAMMRFREAPEDPGRVVVPSGRRDEIGAAEAELARLQTELQGTLQQKSHLASLGLAVAKINHDLRNILASAQLFSDRLASVKDPTVQRLLPKVLAALDRGITLCQDTLAYGRAAEPAPNRRRFLLAPLAEEVGTVLGLGPDSAVAWRVQIDPGLEVDADPDQLFRVLLNLARNALQALEAREAKPAGACDAIMVAARREGAGAVIEVADTGPGIPEALRATLFTPFTGTTRKGGSGLGLAIAAELVRAHGGAITLAEGTLGATFLIRIPDRAVDLAERRQARRA